MAEIKAQPDFCNVQLSAAGAKLGQVRVTGTHIDYTFRPGMPVRVLTSEWRKVLVLQMHNGQPLLALAPDVKPAPAPIVAATPEPMKVEDAAPDPVKADESAPALPAKAPKGGK